MFSIVGDVFKEVRSVSRDVVSPVTDTIEELTGIDSDRQKDILEDLAIGAVLGSVLTKIID